MKDYTYTVKWDKDVEEYRGCCLEFPLLSHFDALPNDALNGIMDLVDDCVQDMRLKGETIPEAIKIYIAAQSYLYE